MLQKLFPHNSIWDIFSYFNKNPTQGFYLREIVRKTRLSPRTVHHALHFLHRNFILSQRKQGNLTIYSLNIDSIITRQIRTLDILLLLQPLIESLKTLSNKIILYGSCAEGSYVNSSDIDLFIVSCKEPEIIKKIDSFQKKSSYPIKPIIEDIHEEIKTKHESKAFYERVEKGLILWESKGE